MSIRSCIYKSCENCINLKYRRTNDVTLFRFPKNPQRRQKWMELGQVPKNLPESFYYFCSDHFDKKFIACCNKRTLLVGEAVPFPYVEQEDDNLDEDAALNYLIYDMDGNNIEEKHEYSAEQEILVESTTVTSEIEGNIDQNQQDFELDYQDPEEFIYLSEDEIVKEQSAACTSNKRKMDIAFVQATSSKQKRHFAPSQEQKTLQNSCEEASIKTTEQKENKKCISNVTQTKSSKEIVEDINPEELVDAQHVTTFIFKGDEYVQMPKEHYINEKIKLMKKLQKMETTLQAIRGHLQALDTN